MSRPVNESGYDLGELILLALDGKITAEQHAHLQDRLIHDPEARDYYFEFLTTYAGFSPYEGSAVSFLRPESAAEGYSGLLSELAEDEKVAPAVEIAADEAEEAPPVELIQKVRRQPIGLQFNKASIFSIAASAAVILIIVLFDHFVPRRTGQEVATLSDSINAKWADSSFALHSGARLMDSDPAFMLREGYAALHFDNNAKIVIEGPAEFQVLSGDRIRLNYGLLYAAIPDTAHGFTVQTAHARVIDLGTEFGVKESLDGETEIHVIKGGVQLTAKLNGKEFDTVVSDGLAMQVSARLERIREITFNRLLFARKIDSPSGLVWRGLMTVDLADVVGGGNGRGTGRTEIGIDPLSGQRCDYYSRDRQGDRRYVPVPEDRYIDGVFVPQGDVTQIVSTMGHVFEECPVTNNIFYAGIFTGSGKNLADYHRRPAQASLGGRLYGTLEYPSIFMHANLGITFDLDAIRSDLPGFTVERFVSDAGLSSDTPRQGNVDMWVLVDGQVRYSSLSFREKGKAISIDIPLRSSDRFLSLVVTDGGDEDRPSVPGSRSTDSDWCVFGYPRLGLSYTE
jgi:hypothetical protein